MEFRQTRSISSGARERKGGKIFGVFFFSIFFLVGAGIFYAIALKPALKAQAAKTWDKIPATVISSEVGSHRSDDGTTYSIDIEYQYTYKGHTYYSDEYDFFSMSSSGYSGKKEVVDKYPSGKRFYCYVNPEDPNEAVISRELGLMILIGLFPLIFVVIGLGGMFFMFSGGKRKRGHAPHAAMNADMEQANFQYSDTHATALPSQAWLSQGMPSYDRVSSGEYQLKPQISPWAKVIGLSIFALFWNGIISIFLFQVAEGWSSGNPNWFLTLFLTPFVLIGLGTIAGVGYFLLALFNPRPILYLRAPAFRLGETVNLRWELQGRSHLLRDLRISLKGVESARYRRGTSTYTDTETFFDMEIARSGSHGGAAAGQASIQIPEQTMHSFASANNGITWTISMHGDIPRWPDLKESFTLVVMPKEEN